MTWDGSLRIDGNAVRGTLKDAWNWEIAVVGMMDGANRINLLQVTLATVGREAPKESVVARREHEMLLKPGAVFSGVLQKTGTDIRRDWRWAGSMVGPWTMRLTQNQRWDGGPIGLKGDAI